MRGRLWIALAVAGIAGLAFWFAGGPGRHEPPAPESQPAAGPKADHSATAPVRPIAEGPPAPASEPEDPASPLSPAPSALPPGTITSPVQIGAGAPSADGGRLPLPAARRDPSAPPGPPPQPDEPARVEADAIALNIRHFSQRFGGNPEGSNAEIVKTLNGGNPKGVRYLPPELLRLNAEGELIDQWGTPYFFHQMSADHMEVRSAGPDGRMWTVDDVVTR